MMERFWKWLLALASRKLGVKLCALPPEVWGYVARASALCFENEGSASGESKRHQVYARLIKEFPEAKKRRLALAIEVAMNRSSF
jgi:hypothetical protein